MSKKSRFLLLIFFALAFSLITPLVVLNARGYQFSFEEKKLVSTGGIFLKSMPKKAQVYLNNKLLKVQTPAFIKELPPAEHLLRVEEFGFHPWEKKIVVKTTRVSKLENILLLPLNPKRKPLDKLPALIKPSQSEEDKLEFNEHEIYLKRGEIKKLVTRYAQKIKQAFLYKDRAHIIFIVGNTVKFIEIDGTNIVDFVKADKILYQDDKLYLQQNKNWFQVDLD